MQLPQIAPGKRFTVPRPTGSADALLLARFAERQAGQKKVLAVITAEPADVQRLPDELAFFAPGLRVAVFPDWETLREAPDFEGWTLALYGPLHAWVRDGGVTVEPLGDAEAGDEDEDAGAAGAEDAA